MVHLNNTCEITIVKRTPELTVDGKCLCINSHCKESCSDHQRRNIKEKKHQW